MKLILGSNKLSSTITIVFLALLSGCGFLNKNQSNSTGSTTSHESVTTSPVFAPTTPQSTNSPTVAQTPPPTTSNTPPAIAQNGCLQPSSRDYIYGNYSVGWTLHGDYYKSVLLMKGSTGKMLTEYFNPRIKGTDAVLQTMKLQICSFGVVLIGSNPLNPKTQKPNPNYSPDGLVMSRQPNGKVLIFACDTAKNCSPAQVKRISG